MGGRQRVTNSLRGLNEKALKDYQENHLGRCAGQTFLTEFFPPAQPKIGAWDYDDLFPDFSSRKQYEECVREQRLALLGSLLLQHRPKIVICYGKYAWKYFKALFQDTGWHHKKPFRYGLWNGVHVFRTPHFVQGHMNGKVKKLCRLIEEQLGVEELAKILKP